MAAADERVHVGDVGTVVELEFTDTTTGAPFDLTGALELVAVFTRPDRTTTEVGLAVQGTPTDGVAAYTIPAGFLTQRGPWGVRGRVTTPLGTWHTTQHTLQVHP